MNSLKIHFQTYFVRKNVISWHIIFQALLSLFRINDPYRIIIILLILCAVRIPMLVFGLPITQSELNWLLIGEKLATFGNTMYLDLWDNTGALASGVYFVLHVLFGKSLLAHRIVAMALIMLQATIFNNLLINSKAYTENNMLPALFYVLFSLFVPQMLVLSPILLGNTFVLLALTNLFKRLDNFTRDDLFLNMGILLGTASLFYMPFALFFLIVATSLLLYSSAILRRMLLLLHGFLLVIALAFGYFYLFDAAHLWWNMSVISWWKLQPLHPLGWERYLLLMSIPMVVILVSVLRTYGYGRYVNYQSKYQNVMVFLLIGSILIILTAYERVPYQIMLLLPIIAFFLPHYLIQLRKKWQAEFVFLFFVVLPLLHGVAVYNNWFYPSNILILNRINVVEVDNSDIVIGKKVLVLGDQKDYYLNSTLATPFLNWQLSERLFKDPDYYSKLMTLNRYLNNDLPELIIDPNNYMTPIFERLPQLKEKYIRKEESLNYYTKKPNS